ncbi:putative Ribonuclease H-like domain-containing protein [Seiridium unicorne]|uniref:Ribonuclease H-like domain-containing protein n=1 Tax=Seiridium unicorne TaxID=138068 RepID=A0ABR2UQ42_9PEZI
MHYNVNTGAWILYNRRYILDMASYGLWMGTIFEAPSNLSSDSISSLRPTNSLNNLKRTISTSDTVTPLDFLSSRQWLPIDGACSSNGLAALKGGFAFVFNNTSTGVHSYAPGKMGLNNHLRPHTSNRAEL